MKDSLALEKALSRLKKAHLKVTPIRKSLLNFLLKHHGPFPIEEIHKKTLGDRVTIYRTLDSLERAGLIHKVFFGDNIVRYEYHDPDFHHHHVICRSCDKVDEVDLCPLDFLEKQLQKMGYSQVEHSVSFFAVCPNCQSG